MKRSEGSIKEVSTCINVSLFRFSQPFFCYMSRLKAISVLKPGDSGVIWVSCKLSYGKVQLLPRVPKLGWVTLSDLICI